MVCWMPERRVVPFCDTKICCSKYRESNPFYPKKKYRESVTSGVVRYWKVIRSRVKQYCEWRPISIQSWKRSCRKRCGMQEPVLTPDPYRGLRLDGVRCCIKSTLPGRLVPSSRKKGNHGRSASRLAPNRVETKRCRGTHGMVWTRAGPRPMAIAQFRLCKSSLKKNSGNRPRSRRPFLSWTVPASYDW